MSRQLRRKSFFLVALTVVAAAAAFSTSAIGSTAASGRAVIPVGVGSDRTGAVAFLKTVVTQIAHNDYATAWATLAPVQQQAIPRAEYVRCESASPIPGRLDWIKTVRVFDELVTVAGSNAGPTLATAATLRIRISDPAIHDAVVILHTVHAVRANGRWAWILPGARFQLHRSGACLGV
jgi:hypothetical protein